MTAIVVYFIAGLSTVAFFTLWIMTSYRELNSKKREVAAAAQQVHMHRKLYKETHGDETVMSSMCTKKTI